MECKLTRVLGSPDCDISGPTGAKVTLQLVETNGTAMFESASYDKESIISGATDELSFTLKEGAKRLSIVCTFSSNNGKAELREKCDGATVLDDDITAVNNGKLYHVCGTAAVPQGAIRISKKNARKKHR